jgi:hypothetical protein
MTVTRHRKKPVEVDTIQWTGDNALEVVAFTGPENLMTFDDEVCAEDPDATAAVFDKLHSTWVLVYTGQHIVRGVKGEYYPLADDVLAETYEPAAASSAPADRAALAAEAAVERVRSVLESEAVVGRSALDYRGLITSALMADDVSGPGRVAGEAQQPCPGYETTPNRCTCDCEGCKHHCAAHQAVETQQSEPRPDTPRCAHCTHPKGDHSDRKDHTPSPTVPRRPWCHACNATCDYDEQPAGEAQQPETKCARCGHGKAAHNVSGCLECPGGWQAGHRFLIVQPAEEPTS